MRHEIVTSDCVKEIITKAHANLPPCEISIRRGKVWECVLAWVVAAVMIGIAIFINFGNEKNTVFPTALLSILALMLAAMGGYNLYFYLRPLFMRLEQCDDGQTVYRSLKGAARQREVCISETTNYLDEVRAGKIHLIEIPVIDARILTQYFGRGAKVTQKKTFTVYKSVGGKDKVSAFLEGGVLKELKIASFTGNFSFYQNTKSRRLSFTAKYTAKEEDAPAVDSLL